MEYAAIITYTTGEKTGATVKAPDREMAWRKLLEDFDYGDRVQAAELCEILTDDREIC